MPKESYPFDLTKANHTQTVTYVWASDGWCYIPELQRRHRFTVTRRVDTLIMTEESWSGVIPLPENLDKVELTVLSLSPRAWMEECGAFCEIYVEQ